MGTAGALRSLTGALQGLYRGLTGALQGPYRRLAGPRRALQGPYRGLTGALQGPRQGSTVPPRTQSKTRIPAEPNKSRQDPAGAQGTQGGSRAPTGDQWAQAEEEEAPGAKRSPLMKSSARWRRRRERPWEQRIEVGGPSEPTPLGCPHARHHLVQTTPNTFVCI